MRVSLIFAKEALSVKEYAYCEDKNEHFRNDMEDSTLALTRLRRPGQYH